nr:NAD(P)H-dependent oxidoreductase [Hyphomicrobium sp.]
MTEVVSDQTLPNISEEPFAIPTQAQLEPASFATHKPRILMLYGSVRERSYSRLLTYEAARLLTAYGAEVKVFDPRGLPLPDGAPTD